MVEFPNMHNIATNCAKHLSCRHHSFLSELLDELSVLPWDLMHLMSQGLLVVLKGLAAHDVLHDELEIGELTPLSFSTDLPTLMHSPQHILQL